MKKLLAALAMSALVASPTLAAPCRDAKGKFVKCPDKPPVKCKDAKGKFAKCGTPGAKPVK